MYSCLTQTNLLIHQPNIPFVVLSHPLSQFGFRLTKKTPNSSNKKHGIGCLVCGMRSTTILFISSLFVLRNRISWSIVTSFIKKLIISIGMRNEVIPLKLIISITSFFFKFDFYFNLTPWINGEFQFPQDFVLHEVGTTLWKASFVIVRNVNLSFNYWFMSCLCRSWYYFCCKTAVGI